MGRAAGEDANLLAGFHRVKLNAVFTVSECEVVACSGDVTYDKGELAGVDVDVANLRSRHQIDNLNFINTFLLIWPRELCLNLISTSILPGSCRDPAGKDHRIRLRIEEHRRHASGKTLAENHLPAEHILYFNRYIGIKVPASFLRLPENQEWSHLKCIHVVRQRPASLPGVVLQIELCDRAWCLIFLGVVGQERRTGDELCTSKSAHEHRTLMGAQVVHRSSVAQ